MMNAGEDGAETDFEAALDISASWGDLGWVMPGEGGTLRERFFWFRGFLLGVWGLEQCNSGLGGTIDRSFATRLSDLNDGSAIEPSAVSGDESGVMRSSKEADSTVDIVVVGEELFEDEADVEMLLCDLCVWWCIDGSDVMSDCPGNPENWIVSLTGEQPDISVSKIDTNGGVDKSLEAVGLPCDLQNGYRRFSDNDIRLSAGGLRAGTLNGGILSCGDGGFDATSVYVLFNEGGSVFVTDAMANEMSFRTERKDAGEDKRRTITKGRKRDGESVNAKGIFWGGGGMEAGCCCAMRARVDESDKVERGGTDPLLTRWWSNLETASGVASYKRSLATRCLGTRIAVCIPGNARWLARQ
jgi:hypothetical protein